LFIRQWYRGPEDLETCAEPNNPATEGAISLQPYKPNPGLSLDLDGDVKSLRLDVFKKEEVKLRVGESCSLRLETPGQSDSSAVIMQKLISMCTPQNRDILVSVRRHADEDCHPFRKRIKYSAAINESNCKFKI
jgi:hypothetical protein